MEQQGKTKHVIPTFNMYLCMDNATHNNIDISLQLVIVVEHNSKNMGLLTTW